MIPTGPNKMKIKLIVEIAIHRGASAGLEMQITMGTLTQEIPEEQQPCRSQMDCHGGETDATFILPSRYSTRKIENWRICFLESRTRCSGKRPNHSKE